MPRNNNERPKIEIIIGSTRPRRVGRQVADWLYNQSAAHADGEFAITDLQEWDLPLLNEPAPARDGSYEHAHTKKWSEHIRKADGYIIITSENNAGYPASLKNALDYLHDEWNHKPVGLVGYGWSGGRRAMSQLEQVLKHLHMDVLTTHLNIDFKPTTFNNEALIADPQATLKPYKATLETLINELVATTTKEIDTTSTIQ